MTPIYVGETIMNLNNRFFELKSYPLQSNRFNAPFVHCNGLDYNFKINCNFKSSLLRRKKYSGALILITLNQKSENIRPFFTNLLLSQHLFSYCDMS